MSMQGFAAQTKHGAAKCFAAGWVEGVYDRVLITEHHDVLRGKNGPGEKVPAGGPRVLAARRLLNHIAAPPALCPQLASDCTPGNIERVELQSGSLQKRGPEEFRIHNQNRPEETGRQSPSDFCARNQISLSIQTIHTDAEEPSFIVHVYRTIPRPACLLLRLLLLLLLLPLLVLHAPN
jgi:hypothetical protein